MTKVDEDMGVEKFVGKSALRMGEIDGIMGECNTLLSRKDWGLSRQKR